MLKVWGRVSSMNVQKVLWTLVELGLDYERTDAGMAFGVVQTPDYLAMNPNALVPTLDDEGLILWESNVIVRYLATKYGMGGLCPDDLARRFRAERWMDWQQTTLYPPIGPIFIQLVRLSAEKRDPATIERNRGLAESVLAILDRHLASHRWMNGDRFSMADIPAGTSANRWDRLPIERQQRPNIERWLGELRERPGFRTHVDIPPS